MAFLLVGQTSAALRSSASQNLATVGGSHSLTETVLHLAMTLLGLICTEHCCSPFRSVSGAAIRVYTRPQPDNVILYTILSAKVKVFFADKPRFFGEILNSCGGFFHDTQYVVENIGEVGKILRGPPSIFVAGIARSPPKPKPTAPIRVFLADFR